eukprot:scaffold1161_cov391-Prasinococcus_capsulatus_cf.AAC.7
MSARRWPDVSAGVGRAVPGTRVRGLPEARAPHELGRLALPSFWGPAREIVNLVAPVAARRGEPRVRVHGAREPPGGRAIAALLSAGYPCGRHSEGLGGETTRRAGLTRDGDGV